MAPILMRYPGIDTYAGDFERGYPEAVNEAQAKQMEDQGWVRVDDGETDYRSMRMDQLRELVEQAQAEGFDAKPEGRSKADYVKALEKVRAAGRAETPETIQGP